MFLKDAVQAIFQFRHMTSQSAGLLIQFSAQPHWAVIGKVDSGNRNFK
jgi:hypothetical protein